MSRDVFVSVRSIDGSVTHKVITGSVVAVPSYRQSSKLVHTVVASTIAYIMLPYCLYSYNLTHLEQTST